MGASWQARPRWTSVDAIGTCILTMQVSAYRHHDNRDDYAKYQPWQPANELLEGHLLPPTAHHTASAMRSTIVPARANFCRRCGSLNSLFNTFALLFQNGGRPLCNDRVGVIRNRLADVVDKPADDKK